MRTVLCESPKVLGEQAALDAATQLRACVTKRGTARLLVSTGASQFTFFEAFVKLDVPWDKVEMFHLDEYVGMPETHPASFVGYLKERFVNRVHLKKAHFIDGTENVKTCIARVTKEIRIAPIDVGLIGIGENAHIAFNDPPADFECTAAFKTVQLDEACRKQQLGEGWFATLEDVPRTAISMTVHQIMQCRKIICAVPYRVKARAVHDTLNAPEVTNLIPATMLHNHADVTLYLDPDSASMLEMPER